MGIRIFGWLLRVAGLLALILGILFWINVIDPGNNPRIQDIHMLLGIIVVVSLWALGILQGLRGGSFGLALGTFIWGLVIIFYGYYQQNLLPESTSSFHWVIQLIHLLLGLSAIGFGEMITARTRRRARKA